MKYELWFAFKIYIFGFLIQPVPYVSCDLLSKFISLAFWYNKRYGWQKEIFVVICFQNLYLWLSDTTDIVLWKQGFGLWFAFKIYIFGFLIQHDQMAQRGKLCCDLLSKFISLAFWYNIKILLRMRQLLWFAFKIYIFGFLIQLKIASQRNSYCCDLLSKFISLAFWYNQRWAG